jgi:hypothetical protein
VGNRLVRTVLVAGLLASVLFLASRLKDFYWPGNQQDYEPVQPIAFSHQLHCGKLGISCVYCHFGAEQSRHAGFPAASLCMNCHALVTASREATLREFQRARQVGEPARLVVSAELQKLYDALGLDDNLQPNPAKQAALPVLGASTVGLLAPPVGQSPFLAASALFPGRARQAKPIAWVKVHNLPAFTCFDHRPHVAAGVTCQQCHGPVETMERVRQVENLSMGWCVNCHRETAQTGVAGKKVRPSTDCSACHY